LHCDAILREALDAAQIKRQTSLVDRLLRRSRSTSDNK